MRETQKWIERPPGLLGKAMGFLGKPIDFAYARVPENIKESISNALYQVLTSVRDHSRSTVRTQGIYDQLSVLACQDVRTPQQAQRLPLAVVDQVARHTISGHRQLGMLQGGATGLAGLPGLVADIPSLYFLVFRTVQEVALTYGFPPDSESELDHVLKVVDVGHYLENDKKRKAMVELESLQDMMRQGVPMKDLERTVIAKSLQAFSRQLATAITRRKLAQTVAVIGAAVGASVNSALVGDVGDAAYYAYRRRFLLERVARRSAIPKYPTTEEAAPDPAPEATPPAE